MEKNREITVKGIGNLIVPVDYVEILLTLDEINRDYQKGYETFQNHIIELQKIIQKAGFEKKELKTSEIKICNKYERERKGSDYVEVFKGYRFYTSLKLNFDFDSKKIGKFFSVISNSEVAPKIDVNFTIKDKESVKKALLANAAKDAKEKASILCEAMGVKLGKIITINYNWDEIRFFSPTSYDLDTDKFCVCGVSDSSIDFTPDDISVNDDACFVWDIED